jgi:hypothetical protein
MKKTKGGDDMRVGEEWHKATLDSVEINRSIARANAEPQFRDIAIELVAGLKYPVFKYQIVDHVKCSTNCSDYIALFETLNPSIQYDDKDQIRAAFEVNIPHTGSDENLAIPGRREIGKTDTIRTTPLT